MKLSDGRVRSITGDALTDALYQENDKNVDGRGAGVESEGLSENAAERFPCLLH